MTGLPLPVRAVLSRLLSIVLVACLAGAASAQERLPRERPRTGDTLLTAFRPVVAEAAKSTVRIAATEAGRDKPRDVALGVIVSSDGYILTKASELRKEVVCRLHDGRSLKGERVASNGDVDLALIKVDATGLPAVSWASSDVAVGQWLATTGQEDSPLAVGVVSVRPRNIPRERPVLGVSVTDADQGPKIADLAPDSGALRAGLKIGDVIVEISGKAIRNGADLADRISAFRTGETVELKVLRDEQTLQVEATLGRRIPDPFSRGIVQNQLGGDLSARRDGFPSAIQHDTVLRPEDCGGPVVGLDGKAVGINIARAGRTESYALPASVLVPAIEALKREATAAMQTSTGK